MAERSPRGFDPATLLTPSFTAQAAAEASSAFANVSVYRKAQQLMTEAALTWTATRFFQYVAMSAAFVAMLFYLVILGFGLKYARLYDAR